MAVTRVSSEGQPPDRRRQRHLARRDEIIAAAWQVAREEGLTGMSMRTLADRVGLRQPSLYSYFDSKLGIYDAMFADGNERLWGRLQALHLPAEPRAAVARLAGELTAFATEDPVVTELLYSRTVPGFEPSEASFARAHEFDAWGRDLLSRAGATEQHQQDAFIIMVNGAANVQHANEPGGSRWTSQLGWMMQMYFRELDRQNRQRP